MKKPRIVILSFCYSKFVGSWLLDTSGDIIINRGKKNYIKLKLEEIYWKYLLNWFPQKETINFIIIISLTLIVTLFKTILSLRKNESGDDTKAHAEAISIRFNPI